MLGDVAAGGCFLQSVASTLARLKSSSASISIDDLRERPLKEIRGGGGIKSKIAKKRGEGEREREQGQKKE